MNFRSICFLEMVSIAFIFASTSAYSQSPLPANSVPLGLPLDVTSGDLLTLANELSSTSAQPAVGQRNSTLRQEPPRTLVPPHSSNDVDELNIEAEEARAAAIAAQEGLLDPESLDTAHERWCELANIKTNNPYSDLAASACNRWSDYLRTISVGRDLAATAEKNSLRMLESTRSRRH